MGSVPGWQLGLGPQLPCPHAAAPAGPPRLPAAQASLPARERLPGQCPAARQHWPPQPVPAGRS